MRTCPDCGIAVCPHREARGPDHYPYKIGFELEFIAADQPRTLYPFGHLHGDGSIVPDDDDAGYCGEFASFPTSRLVTPLVNRVTSLISRVDGYVNHTCGLHVHVGNYPTLIRLKRWQLLENLMFELVKPERRQNDYCKPVSEDPDDWPENRYFSLNISNSKGHDTLEYRLHHGTLNPREILDWIDICSTVTVMLSMPMSFHSFTPSTLYNLLPMRAKPGFIHRLRKARSHVRYRRLD